MNTALFTFRRRVEVVEAGVKVEKFNDNFINPINVTSFYWSENTDGKRILNVFLNAVRTSASGSTNAYSITFGETIGQRFQDHMEDFLRFMIWGNAGRSNQAQQDRPERHQRSARRVTDIVDDESVAEQTTDTQWVAQ